MSRDTASSYGSRNTRVLGAVTSLGFTPIYWTLDSLDSVEEKKTPQHIYDRIISQKDADLDGAIILMHVGEPATAEVVPSIVQTLQARGFTFMTISEMLHLR